eukprot:NODE_2685_length_656_cov_13.426689_g2213_i0.p2 GENE.NODE_2685_length_656_cov_13.426689_g2213_i0~~NODE_2685_length_656_cov_13.426689_g2213_i0.p2  ORF type:complete len:92 (+),score=9.85 NODE_2685_length_656_cov_13.426689_g2213_i0:329-604(+)
MWGGGGHFTPKLNQIGSSPILAHPCPSSPTLRRGSAAVTPLKQDPHPQEIADLVVIWKFPGAGRSEGPMRPGEYTYPLLPPTPSPLTATRG